MVRKILYKTLGVELPTNKPLWSYEEGLKSIIGEDGSVKSLPGKKYSFVSEQDKRLVLFNSMKVRQDIVDIHGRVLVKDVPAKVERIVNQIISNKSRYEQIAHQFANPIKWYHIGLLHEMECKQNFHCYLGNGQPLYKKTTIVPKGRGPFSSFIEGALDTICYDGLDNVNNWSIGNTLYILEGFNGYGYEKYRGINSPYIWSGSNNYFSGKYIADSVYDKNYVSRQIGIALLLKALIDKKVV